MYVGRLKNRERLVWCDWCLHLANVDEAARDGALGIG